MVSDFVLGSYVLSLKPKTKSDTTHGTPRTASAGSFWEEKAGRVPGRWRRTGSGRSATSAGPRPFRFSSSSGAACARTRPAVSSTVGHMMRCHLGSMDRLTLACCKVGLDRPLIPTAFVADLFRSARLFRPRRSAFRSARVSRPRRPADRGSPGDAPPVGGLGDRRSQRTGGSGEPCPNQPSRYLVQAAHG